MGKDRNVACVNYLAERECAIGREGTFHSACQRCQAYEPLKGGKPLHGSLKREKIAAFEKNWRRWES